MLFALNILSLIQLMDGPWGFPKDILTHSILSFTLKVSFVAYKK